MKKLFITLALVCSALPAFAQHHGFHHHGPYYRGPGFGWWVAPVVTGVIGYEIGRQQTVVVQPQPVIVQQPTTIQNQNCTPWTETQQPDGSIVRTRTCSN